jgi:hypothetical protein
MNISILVEEKVGYCHCYFGRKEPKEKHIITSVWRILESRHEVQRIPMAHLMGRMGKRRARTFSIAECKTEG